MAFLFLLAHSHLTYYLESLKDRTMPGGSQHQPCPLQSSETKGACNQCVTSSACEFRPGSNPVQLMTRRSRSPQPLSAVVSPPHKHSFSLSHPSLQPCLPSWIARHFSSGASSAHTKLHLPFILRAIYRSLIKLLGCLI